MQDEEANKASVLQETSANGYAPADEDIDLWLLKDSLAKTPWERMLANDDALNFAESLQTAMKNRNAKSI